ncbi:hypothetical protein H9P43_004675 [Blastocladiella emersonii ATCC 22665]|nr:hypothetical protein H9P43_004675 [Blastocladiella emersonii ATCC 22665]
MYRGFIDVEDDDPAAATLSAADLDAMLPSERRAYQQELDRRRASLRSDRSAEQQQSRRTASPLGILLSTSPAPASYASASASASPLSAEFDRTSAFFATPFSPSTPPPPPVPAQHRPYTLDAGMRSLPRIAGTLSTSPGALPHDLRRDDNSADAATALGHPSMYTMSLPRLPGLGSASASNSRPGSSEHLAVAPPARGPSTDSHTSSVSRASTAGDASFFHLELADTHPAEPSSTASAATPLSPAPVYPTPPPAHPALHYDEDFFSTPFQASTPAPASSATPPGRAPGGPARAATTYVTGVPSRTWQATPDPAFQPGIYDLSLAQVRPNTAAAQHTHQNQRHAHASASPPASASAFTATTPPAAPMAIPIPPPPPEPESTAGNNNNNNYAGLFRSMSLPPNAAVGPGGAGAGSLDNYLLEAVVGVGAFSKVRLGIHRRTRAKVAVKLVELKSDLSRRMAENEALVFRTLQGGHLRLTPSSSSGESTPPSGTAATAAAAGHPAILQCYDVVHAPGSTALILEYCPGGDLFDLLAYRHDEVALHDAQSLAYQVCSAVAFMHAHRVVHRDLKLENILLVARASPFRIKLSDFGLSYVLQTDDEQLATRCGSEEYSAPEVIVASGTPFDPRAADVWSIGVILYAVLVGQLPFSQEARDVVVVEKVVVTSPATPAAGAPPKRVSGLLRHLEDKLSLGGNNGSHHHHDYSSAAARSASPPLLSVGTGVTDLPIPEDQEAPPSPVVHHAPLDSPDADPSPPPVVRKILRRRSTRKAGRKALWHRIARAEFTFPDEAVELAPSAAAAAAAVPAEEEVVETEPASAPAAAANVPSNPQYPLLTDETKLLVRTLLDPHPAHRPTAAACLEIPWIAAGRPGAATSAGGE